MELSFIMVFLLSVIEIFADFQLRFYAQTNNTFNLGFGILGYLGVVYFLIQALRLENVLYVNALWDGMSGLIESIAAFVILGDRLKLTQNYVGIVLIVAGVYLTKLKIPLI
jgi:multidrug transporter EmrE-like cation transporter